MLLRPTGIIVVVGDTPMTSITPELVVLREAGDNAVPRIEQKLVGCGHASVEKTVTWPGLASTSRDQAENAEMLARTQT